MAEENEKTRSGKPRKSERRRKTKAMLIRFTPEQWALVEAAAEAEMIPMVTWSRRCLLLGTTRPQRVPKKSPIRRNVLRAVGT